MGNSFFPRPGATVNFSHSAYLQGNNGTFQRGYVTVWESVDHTRNLWKKVIHCYLQNDTNVDKHPRRFELPVMWWDYSENQLNQLLGNNNGEFQHGIWGSYNVIGHRRVCN